MVNDCETYYLNVYASIQMLLSHIGEYASEYVSLKFAVNSPKKLRIDSEYFNLSHPSTSPYEYIVNALRMLANAYQCITNC